MPSLSKVLVPLNVRALPLNSLGDTVRVPLLVRLALVFSVILAATAVVLLEIVTTLLVLITTISVATGTIPKLQFEAVAQSEFVVALNVFVVDALGIIIFDAAL